MNLTEFAEQVVFGTTLDEKLQTPGELSDDVGNHGRRGPNVDSLASPGRPHGMQMHRVAGGKMGSGANAQPPSDDRLENERERGQLLHFLANHELLATELMALVLLKFPDAPAEFRQGVLATLQEEQAHTKMYLRRMQECGVEFGTYPLSGQFWRIVEPMQSPLDFVSRLSLTFEQANLDYSLHFAKVFDRIGDKKTAAVLGKIYQDEIGHVQHGLHWFRQWKNPELSDWQAYQQSLEFPMSPQRGRGPRGAFNRKGRLKAGLSEEFINAIEVFRQSRGRAPTVWWFDSGAEAELAGPLSARDASLLQQLSADLELLMVAMTRQDDVLLVRRQPSRDFCKQLMDVGVDLPEFVTFDDQQKLTDRKLHELSPWAWTPGNCKLAESLAEITHHRPPVLHVDPTELFSKSWAAAKLSEWQNKDSLGWFTHVNCVATPVTEPADVTAALSHFGKLGYQRALFKQDLAASGRGQRRLPCCEPLCDADEGWLRAFFESNAGRSSPVGIVEPELDRVLDISCLWHLPHDAETPTYLGWTRSMVTGGRRYAGTRLGNSLRDCDAEIKKFLLANRCERIKELVEWLQPRLTEELQARNFVGYFGIDALVCRDVGGTLRIKPMVELNPRMTMGHLALNLEKRLAPGVDADFRILTAAEWHQCANELRSYPLQRTQSGHWHAGVVHLSETDEYTKLAPVLLVGPQVRLAEFQC